MFITTFPYRIPLAPPPPATTPRAPRVPAAAGLWAGPDPALLWPWRCSAPCRCPCTYPLHISCPENTSFDSSDKGALVLGIHNCLWTELTLWAAWSSSFRELISCFRYWTSDSFTLSITYKENDRLRWKDDAENLPEEPQLLVKTSLVQTCFCDKFYIKILVCFQSRTTGKELVW